MDVNLLGFPSYLERDCIRYGTIALYIQLAVIYTTMLAGLVMDVNLLGFFQVNSIGFACGTVQMNCAYNQL